MVAVGTRSVPGSSSSTSPNPARTVPALASHPSSARQVWPAGRNRLGGGRRTVAAVERPDEDKAHRGPTNVCSVPGQRYEERRDACQPRAIAGGGESEQHPL